MEYRGDERKPALYFTHFHVIVFLMAMVSSACQTPHKQTPLSVESVITPVDMYESYGDKNLATTYRDNLKNIFNKVRVRFKPQQLDFFLISGIGFRKIRIDKTYDTYLSLHTKTSQQFLDANTTFSQRASTVFKRYITPLLKIAAKEKAILNDDTIAGIAITIRWSVKKTLKEKHHITLYEQVSLIAQKEEMENYLHTRITDQELLEVSTLISTNEGENPQIIKLHLE
jgi:hypothetical protein